MDNPTVLDNDFRSASGLHVDDIAKSYLAETAKWGKFLAIVGFITVGLMVIAAIGMLIFGTALSSAPGMEATPFAAFGGGLFGLFYLLFAAFYFFPSLYLYRFSDRTKRALATNDTPVLTNALGNLKSLYKFIGITTAVFVGLYALGLVFMLVGGGIAALAG